MASREPETTEDDPWRMPHPRRLLDAIDKLRSSDLRTATDESIRSHIQEFLDYIEYFATVRLNTASIGTVHRARFVRRGGIDESLWPWVQHADLLYPPPNAAPLQRCNLPGEPVLYCARNEITCLREMRARPGDELVVASYQMRHASLAMVVPKNKTSALDGKEIFDDSGAISFLIFRDFIRSEFTKPVGRGTEFLYRISAALSRVVFDSDDSDGWVYPSVESPEHECIAFKTAFVDSDRFAIKDATRYTVLAEEHRSFAVRPTHKAVISAAGLSWSPYDAPARWVTAERRPGDRPLVLPQ